MMGRIVLRRQAGSAGPSARRVRLHKQRGTRSGRTLWRQAIGRSVMERYPAIQIALPCRCAGRGGRMASSVDGDCTSGTEIGRADLTLRVDLVQSVQDSQRGMPSSSDVQRRPAEIVSLRCQLVVRLQQDGHDLKNWVADYSERFPLVLSAFLAPRRKTKGKRRQPTSRPCAR